MKAVLFSMLALFVWITSVYVQIIRGMAIAHARNCRISMCLNKINQRVTFFPYGTFLITIFQCVSFHREEKRHSYYKCLGKFRREGRQAGIDMAKYLYSPVARNGIS